MRIYISGALKGSQDLREARKLYELAAELVEGAGCLAYLPHQTTDPEMASGMSAECVFQRDLVALRECGAVIAFLNEPSLGVGAELGICTTEMIPVLGLCREEADISRFAEGCLKASGNKVVRYGSEEDLASAVKEFAIFMLASSERRSNLRVV